MWGRAKKRRKNGQIARAGGFGSGLAPEALHTHLMTVLSLLIGLLAPLSLTGCLVTDPIEFEEDVGSPPVLLDPLSREFLGGIVWLSPEEPTSWTFSMRVWDEDVTQNLQAHWRIVKKDVPVPEFEKPTIELPATGAVVRELQIVLQSSQLTGGPCHRIEVAVSGSFYQGEGRDDPEYFALTRVDDDLSVGSWTIWRGEPDFVTDGDALAIFESCPTINNLFATPTSTPSAP